MRTLAAIILLLAVGRAEGAAPDADIARFITAKSNQVYLASRDSDKPVPPEVWKMFAAASAADWMGTSNLFLGIATNYHSGPTRRLAPEVWGRVNDVGGFAILLSTNNLKFVRLFANEILNVIPPGSLYFGGTEAGRFAVTALSRSHEEGKPFFTLTQNQLADGDYLKYARSIYHESVKLPDDARVRQAFGDYAADAARRYQHDQQFPNEPKQIVPGEDIQNVNGRLQISGTTAIMAVNGLLVRDILNANPDRDFYIEESYALDWMYPYMEPAGPILKLRHAPMEMLFEETIRADREYWQRLTRRLTGAEVHDETTLAEVCASAQELGGRGRDSQGDDDFLRDPGARLAFAKLRSAISGLYIWRAAHAKSTSERRQMNREGELACKQAFLLGPRNTDAVWRYVTFLLNGRRFEEAQKLFAVAEKLNPGDPIIKQLAGYVEQWKRWLKDNPDWVRNNP